MDQARTVQPGGQAEGLHWPWAEEGPRQSDGLKSFSPFSTNDVQSIELVRGTTPSQKYGVSPAS